MHPNPLHSISPLDGRYYSKLGPLRKITSEYGLVYYRYCIEVRWLMHLIQQQDIVPSSSSVNTSLLEQLIDDFGTDTAERVKDIEKTTNHDVKAVEYALAEQLEKHDSLRHFIPYLHFGCTSEDINNLSYALMCQQARQITTESLQRLSKTLSNLSQRHSAISMLSRTHGQPASPTTLGKEIRNVVQRLQSQTQKLNKVDVLGKFNGAVGNYNAHCAAYPHHNWPQICQDFVQSLGLTFNEFTTQIEPHDYLAEVMHCLMRINTVLIDFSRDVWQYISLGYFIQQKKAGEVGSSTMPHKVNPIDFENAEGNLGVANAMAQHLANKLPISRLQRDLSDSTVLRNLGVVFGHSLLAYESIMKGLGKLEINSDRMTADLCEHWELLAEPIQTVLRAHGISDAYEQLKSLTRGQDITQRKLHTFIQDLDIPSSSKQRLLEMSPSNYTGLAQLLTEGES